MIPCTHAKPFRVGDWSIWGHGAQVTSVRPGSVMFGASKETRSSSVPQSCAKASTTPGSLQ